MPTAADICDFAIGDMQLLPAQFYDMTWGEYNCRARGWLRQEEEKWEHTRHLYALLYNTNAKKEDQLPMHKLIPLRKDRRNMLLKAKLAPPKKSRDELIAAIKRRDNLN